MTFIILIKNILDNKIFLIMHDYYIIIYNDQVTFVITINDISESKYLII